MKIIDMDDIDTKKAAALAALNKAANQIYSIEGDQSQTEPMKQEAKNN